MIRSIVRACRSAANRAAGEHLRAFQATRAIARSARRSFHHVPTVTRPSSSFAARSAVGQRRPSFACSEIAGGARPFSAESSGEKKDDDEAEEDGEAEGAEAAEDGEDVDGEDFADEEVQRLTAELDEKAVQVKDLNDKLLRTLADMENLRERTRRQAETAEKFAIQGFCKDLLDVADNLARASATVDTEALETETDAANVKTVLTSLHEGVLMVEKQLTSAFGKHGVVKFDPSEGDPFDPNDHMALFNVPNGEKEAGTVATVTKVGYKLNDRVIRPAEVGVFQSS